MFSVDDITALLMAKNEEVAEMAKEGDEEDKTTSLEKTASNCRPVGVGKKERAR